VANGYLVAEIFNRYFPVGRACCGLAQQQPSP
jgi:hypothetical protein